MSRHDPCTVGLVESHSSATSLGVAVVLSWMAAVSCAGRPDWCHSCATAECQTATLEASNPSDCLEVGRPVPVVVQAHGVLQSVSLLFEP